MTIGKVMDWTEARVDAIKAREEEEEEDEEREKDKDRSPPSVAPPVAVQNAPKSEVKKAGVPHRPKDTTTISPIPNSAGGLLAEQFPSSTSSGTFSETPILIGTGAKRRHAVMMMLDSSSAPISITDPTSVASSPGAGSMNAGTYMGSTGSNFGKRRTRSSRNFGQIQSQNQNINVIQVSPEPMDIEEELRERKRVTRR